LFNIPLKKGTEVVVIGDVHEHEVQFDELVKKIDPSPDRLLVSVGDIYGKGFGTKVAGSIVDKLKTLIDDGVAYVIRGNHELKHIAKYRKNGKPLPEHLMWFAKQPLSLIFKFYNGTYLTVVHGGILPCHTLSDIANNIDTCYIRRVDKCGKMIPLIKSVVDDREELVQKKPDGILWHKLYDGRFGYIASGHDSQKDGIPKFYNYSCNLDLATYHTGKLAGQFFSEVGREELFIVDGKAKRSA
jgi:hypothetical protein